jgi:uncharacterized protein (DUF488 family)
VGPAQREVLTVGHSTHELDAFVELVRRSGARTVADVRRFPGSRRMPWFGSEPLAAALRAAGIDYTHIPELGGRRSGRTGVNAAWRVKAFEAYADHMASEAFGAGLARLLALDAPVVMCAEARWTQCHRRLVSDALVAGGHEVVHVGARGTVERHALTDFAVVDLAGHVTYPR